MMFTIVNFFYASTTTQLRGNSEVTPAKCACIRAFARRRYNL